MGDFPMTMFAAFMAALVLTTVMAASQHDVDEIVPEPEYERASSPVPIAARKEMTKTELLKTPDLTSPNSVIEWKRMWGKGADVTEEAKNEKSCKRRCQFKFAHIGPHALKECNAGCSFYGEKSSVIPAGQRCISGTAECNGFLQTAANTCKSTCARRLKHESWTIEAPLSASKSADAKVVKKMMKGKTKGKKGAKKAAKKKAKKGAKKKKSKKGKLKKAAMNAAKELDSNVDVAKFALHFCSQGCELAAANICFQGSGACLNTPDFQTKWPRVGSCTAKSNKCQANGSPTCSARRCIKTKEQCHAACHTWHGQKSMCLGECNPANAMRSGKKENKVIKKMMKGKGPKKGAKKKKKE